jgi:hypothetical protein
MCSFAFVSDSDELAAKLAELGFARTEDGRGELHEIARKALRTEYPPKRP